MLDFTAPRISQSEINICSALTRTKILDELIVPFLVTAQHRTAGGQRIYGATATPNDEKWERVQRLNPVKGWLVNEHISISLLDVVSIVIMPCASVIVDLSLKNKKKQQLLK